MERLTAHGGDIYSLPHKERILDFSANINPLGQPTGLKEAVFNDFERTLHYPETRAESLAARQDGDLLNRVIAGHGGGAGTWKRGRGNVLEAKNRPVFDDALV